MVRRMHVSIQGAVQGVGFRPFVHRLARSMDLKGWVMNSPQGVTVEVEGAPEDLEAFLLRLDKEKPPHAFFYSLEHHFLDPAPYSGFHIRESRRTGEHSAVVLPDIATCASCLEEIFDPDNRRFRYPFTNCTHCGPRYTIMESLPYDRRNTSMKTFTMCPECRREFEDPDDRRYHAQPNACPVCGPRLVLRDGGGGLLGEREAALSGAVDLIRGGRIVAVKGLGGFHLVVDAANRRAVERLRHRKRRDEKPFALMFPDLESAGAAAGLTPLDAGTLLSPASPIVLVRKTKDPAPEVCDAVAPANPYWGIMLPYTPLHHLLLRDLLRPVVATSGNLSEEPMCTDEDEAFIRLKDVADAFLVHDRPIVRHADDSIVRVMNGRLTVMRRARGYAPLPVLVDREMDETLAVGAHLKNTVAVGSGRRIIVSQHIGDLENQETLKVFEATVQSLKTLFRCEPGRIICDKHPDYLSSRFAESQGRKGRVFKVQHHYAHVLACLAENRISDRVLGVAWDGTGYGDDGTVWGGEFLLADFDGYERFAHLRTFSLPGGDAAVREPRRSALGVLFEMFGERMDDYSDLPCLKALKSKDVSVFKRMLKNGLNCPRTSSAGRLFDAAASLTGLCQTASFEAQAAAALEYLALDQPGDEAYPFGLLDEGREASGKSRPVVVDWQPMILNMIKELRTGKALEIISKKFHNTLAAAILSVARIAGRKKVVLTGGCFQNRTLSETVIRALEREGFQPYWPQRIPPNDGGIALGQAAAASREIGKR